jgi:1,4-dihydroxy-2-naphthoate octaprenyltransferase
VIVGAGAAAKTSTADYRPRDLVIVALCVLVALALQIGVNYANDYSDGVRGTDSKRVGPIRLVGSGLVPAHQVRRAAFACFAVAAAAGLALVLITSQWWWLLAGAAAIAAAWFYTGGKRPYGYAGLGEVFVFVFFGLVAVCGTASFLTGRVSLLSVVVAVPVGLLACAILLANNLRDVHTDPASGKNTLATRIGERRSRTLFVVLMWAPFLVAAGISLVGLVNPYWPRLAALALVAIPLAASPARAVRNGADGAELIPVLSDTARLELIYCILLAIGLTLSAE